MGRRLDALPETVLRDLCATLARMGATGARVAAGGKISKELARWYGRAGVAVDHFDPALVPAGAAIGFARKGVRYRFACARNDDRRDNLRAARLAVSLRYRVFDEYAAGEGREAEASFARLFGGHRLVPGDGAAPAAWHAVLGVPPAAGRAAIDRAFRARARGAHPDKPGGAHAAFVRLKAAHDEGLAALGLRA